MGRRIGWAALWGLIAAVVSWVISRPFAPHLTLGDRGSASTRLLMSVTQGSTGANLYSLLLSFLFGLIFCAAIVWIFSNGRSWQSRTFSMFLGAICGGVLLCAVRFAFDELISSTVSIRLGRGVHSPIALVHWASLCFQISALCFSVYFALGLRKKSALQFIITVFATTVFINPLESVALFIVDFINMFRVGSAISQVHNLKSRVEMIQAADVDTFSSYTYVHLLSLILMGLMLGLLFGLVEMFTRKAWLVQKGGPKTKGYWPVDDQVVRLGCDNACEVYLPQVDDLAPIHAQIQRHSSDYAIVDSGSPGGTYLNGTQINKAWLTHGDTIRTSAYSFEFSMRQPKVRSSGSLRDIAGPDPTVDPKVVTGAKLIDAFGNAYALPEGRTTIGRDAVCEICLKWESTVSTKHARIDIHQMDVVLTDLGSSNGTLLNEKPVHGAVPLKDGDVIEMGQAKLTYRIVHGQKIDIA